MVDASSRIDEDSSCYSYRSEYDSSTLGSENTSTFFTHSVPKNSTPAKKDSLNNKKSFSKSKAEKNTKTSAYTYNWTDSDLSNTTETHSITSTGTSLDSITSRGNRYRQNQRNMTFRRNLNNSRHENNIGGMSRRSRNSTSHRTRADRRDDDDDHRNDPELSQLRSEDSDLSEESSCSDGRDDDTYTIEEYDEEHQYGGPSFEEDYDEGTYDDNTLDDNTLDDNTLDDNTLDGTVDDTIESTVDGTVDETVDETLGTYDTTDRGSAFEWTVEIASQIRNMITINMSKPQDTSCKAEDKNTKEELNQNEGEDTYDEENHDEKTGSKSESDNINTVMEKLPQIGQRVQEQIAQVISVARNNNKCGFTPEILEDEDEPDMGADEDGKMNAGENENMEPKVQGILKKPQVRRFNSKNSNSPTLVPEVPTGPSDFSMITSKFSQTSAFQADWSQCEIESEERKLARELKESRDEVDSLRSQLKDIMKQKQNVESQLEFAKLALESLSLSNSGSFSQLRKGNNSSLCQALEISDGAVGTKPLRRPRNIFHRR